MACAAAELLKKRLLGCDLVMMIEGEEEAGSVGFEDTVRKYKELVGDVDAILVRFVASSFEKVPLLKGGGGMISFIVIRRGCPLMCHVSHTDYEASSIAMWRSVAPAYLAYSYQLNLHDRYHPVEKTHILALKVASWRNQCRICMPSQLPFYFLQLTRSHFRIQLLSTLTDRNRRVLIPGFCKHRSFSMSTETHGPDLDDRVRPQDDEEKVLFTLLESVTQSPASSLAARWREPSLTIHNLEGSGPRSEPLIFSVRRCVYRLMHVGLDPTIIPAEVKAQVSLRIVPDQDLEMVARALCRYLEDSFGKLESSNKLTVCTISLALISKDLLFILVLQVTVDHSADWWLGNLEHPWFKALEGAITDEWGVEPLRIREGGVSRHSIALINEY